MNHLELLKVYNFDKKIRCGSNSDGGYVFAELEGEYDLYISAGISNEESFSRDFISKYNMNEFNSFGFDGTIHAYPYEYTKNISFIKKNISTINDDYNTNLTLLISKYNNIFLKMDIEGGEYPWIQNISDELLQHFKQIVIEFHGITGDEWNTSYNDKIKCFEKLSNTHYIVHAHGNNYGKVVNGFPDVIELTYVNKKYFKKVPEVNRKPLPTPGLDFRNYEIHKDIDLNFYPFVHESNKIYMTYKKPVPDRVITQWKKLNPNYDIDFSLDNDCIDFLKLYFNDYIVDLFISIQPGMYKADLWRLCKLYIHGGVYADVDLVPYINIDTLDKNISFYSCLSIQPNAIFQAFIVNFIKPKNPLLLIFILSFLINKPYNTIHHGPCSDMFNCIKYNLNQVSIIPEKKYEIEEVKINVTIGSSDTNTKKINLYYFPDNIPYHINLIKNPYNDSFNFTINDNILTVERTDVSSGWGYMHSVDICITSKQIIYLFKEIIGENNNHITSYVSHNSQKILDSRSIEYYNNNGW